MIKIIPLSLLFSALLQLLLSIFAWSRRKEPAARPLAIIFFIGSAWAFTYSIEFASTDIAIKMNWALIRMSFNRFLSLATLWMVYEHLEKSLQLKKWIPALLVTPFLSIILIWTSNYQHLYRYEYSIQQVGELNILAWKIGFLYWLLYSCETSVYLVAVYQMIRSFSESSQVKRNQTAMIIIAVFMPLGIDLIFNFGFSPIPGFNFTFYFMILSGMALMLAIFRYGWLRIVPMARSALIEIIPSGMVVIDTRNRVVDINPAARNILGIYAKNIIGTDFSTLLSTLDLNSAIELGSQPSKKELRFELSGRRIGYFDVNIVPLNMNAGKPHGHLIYFNDVTNRMEEELRLLQLEQAVEQSPASVVITDLHGNITYVNPMFTFLTGYARDEALGKNPNIIQSGQTPIEVYDEMWQTIQSGQTWRGDFLNRKKNGELYWENAVISPVIDQDGHIINFIAVKEDITERKHTEKDLQENRRFLADLVEYSGALIFVKDLEGRYQLVNRKYEEVAGLPRETIIGRTDMELFPEETAARFRKNDLRVIESGQVLETEDYVDYPQGRQYLITVKFVLRGVDGSITGICGITTNITERKHAEDSLQKANRQLKTQLREIESLQASLREQAIRDPLTQLYNRRFLNESIERQFHHAKRLSQPLSVILLDVDHFKSINDTYGHVAGDACLISFANLLQQNIRKSDIACRYGGEEFLLVLPDASLYAATQLAEKIRLLFANSALIFEGREIKATISLGVASYPASGESYSEIIKKADKALYRSKYAGRNCVTAWSE